jgi:cytoskeletal protein RodZ
MMKQLGMRLVSASLALLIFCNPALSLAQSAPVANPLASSANSNADRMKEGVQEIAELPDTPIPSSTQSNASPSQSSPPDSSPQNGSAQTKPQQPTGTAAAPAVTTSGNAASRPAGAAIAPPKQRQVHSLLIKVGLIAGCAVAVGTVAALTLASPAKVPGSH